VPVPCPQVSGGPPEVRVRLEPQLARVPDRAVEAGQIRNIIVVSGYIHRVGVVSEAMTADRACGAVRVQLAVAVSGQPEKPFRVTVA